MGGRCLIVIAGLLAAAPASAAETAVTLVAPANADVATVRLAKLVTQELGRRGQPMVSEADGSLALGRPLSAAMSDCSGDDLCYSALGQVVSATQVLIVKAAFSVKDAKNYDCFFHVIDIKTNKPPKPMVVPVIASESGLLTAANTIVEIVAPRPRLTAVATPTPVIPAPTPSPIATATPAPTPAPAATVAVAPAAPTPTPGVAGLDVQPPKPRPPKRPLTQDPAFWSVAGAGALALGIGLFFGAQSLQDDGEEKEGTSTVQVRF